MHWKAQVLVTLASLALTGCGSNWVNLDNSNASPDQLKDAKAVCKIDDRLYQLSHEKTIKDAMVVNAKDDNTKQAFEDAFKVKQKKVRREIDECMLGQGLQRARLDN